MAVGGVGVTGSSEIVIEIEIAMYLLSYRISIAKQVGSDYKVVAKRLKSDSKVIA
jgi:hypothetical protein